MKSQREPEVEGTQQAGEHRCPHNSHRPPTARPSAFHEHNPLPTSCAPRVYGAMNSSISNDLLVCLHSPQHPLISLNQAEQGAHPSHSLTSTTLCFQPQRPALIHSQEAGLSHGLTPSAQPTALCLHNTAEVRGIFPSSLFQNCQVLSSTSREKQISQSHHRLIEPMQRWHASFPEQLRAPCQLTTGVTYFYRQGNPSSLMETVKCRQRGPFVPALEQKSHSRCDAPPPRLFPQPWRAGGRLELGNPVLQHRGQNTATMQLRYHTHATSGNIPKQFWAFPITNGLLASFGAAMTRLTSGAVQPCRCLSPVTTYQPGCEFLTLVYTSLAKNIFLPLPLSPFKASLA